MVMLQWQISNTALTDALWIESRVSGELDCQGQVVICLIRNPRHSP